MWLTAAVRVCGGVPTGFGGAGGVVAAGFGCGSGCLDGGGRGAGRLLGVHAHLRLQFRQAPLAVDVLELLDLHDITVTMAPPRGGAAEKGKRRLTSCRQAYRK